MYVNTKHNMVQIGPDTRNNVIQIALNGYISLYNKIQDDIMVRQ